MKTLHTLFDLPCALCYLAFGVVTLIFRLFMGIIQLLDDAIFPTKTSLNGRKGHPSSQNQPHLAKPYHIYNHEFRHLNQKTKP